MIPAKTITVELLKNGEELPVHEIGLELDYSMLSTLSEAMKEKLKLEILCGEKTLFVRDYDVEAFAADQWLGPGIMPELLTLFITSNLEVVRQLQSVVADEELRKDTGDASINGYQADRKRVYEICAAIYRAIQGDSVFESGGVVRHAGSAHPFCRHGVSIPAGHLSGHYAVVCVGHGVV